MKLRQKPSQSLRPLTLDRTARVWRYRCAACSVQGMGRPG